jgi:predicted  nucleic acid-binding Zn-ribbon protein
VQASTEQQSLILELQLLDNEIMQSNTKLKSLPEIEQLLHIEKRVTAANDELAVVKSEADQIALELRRGEVDVETVTDRITKDEARLSSGNATPKELEQLQHEVESLKKRQEALEEIELEIMIRNDAVIARSNTLTTDLASLQTLKDEISGRLQSATDEINKVIADKNTARNLVAGKIEKALIDLYEKIRGNAGGVEQLL